MRWHGYRVRWRGEEYEAAPDPRPDGLWMRLRAAGPVDGFEPVAPDRHVRPVPAGECERVVFVTTACLWRGAPCQVRAEREGELLVEYTGGLLPVARALGFERVERGVHRAWVSQDEVADLHEQAVLLDL